MIVFVAILGYVLWLLSFPMEGFLLGNATTYLLWFLLPHSFVYFLITIVFDYPLFNTFSKVAVVITAILTVLFPFLNTPKALLILIGIFSPFIFVRALIGLKYEKNSYKIAAIAVAAANLMMFIFVHIPLPVKLKFLIVAMALVPTFWVYIPEKIESFIDMNFREFVKYAILIFVFYLLSGWFYVILIPFYNKVAFYNGCEVFFYSFAVILGTIFFKREKDLILGLGIILALFSMAIFSEARVSVNSSMFLLQGAYGFVDIFFILFLLSFPDPKKAFSYGFGVTTLAISLGALVVVLFSVRSVNFDLLKLGNIILGFNFLLLYMGSKRGWFDFGKEGLLLSNAQVNKIKDRYKFSSREWEVIQRVIEKKTFKRIASELGISESTVKTYMLRIYQKTKASNRAELESLLKEEIELAKKNTSR